MRNIEPMILFVDDVKIVFMKRKYPPINWKKILWISITPFIPLYILWFGILNPPWWLRNSPDYTWRLIKNKEYPGGANYRQQVLKPFTIPEIPTSTRPLITFQIYPPGQKYSVLWAYDYIAKNKIEFALYKRHPRPIPSDNSLENEMIEKFKKYLGISNGINIQYLDDVTRDSVFAVYDGEALEKNSYLYYPKTIYAYDGATDEYTKLYETYSYGECSNPLFWNKDRREIYAYSKYPVSSEDYITNYCIISSETGKVITKLTQPNANFKENYDVVFDRDSKRLLVDDGGNRDVTYMVDFLKRTVRQLAPGFRRGYSPQPSTYHDSRIVLLSDTDEGYVVYDIGTNTMSQITPFPNDGITNKYGYSYRILSISPSHSYILFSHYDSDTEKACYHVTDYRENRTLANFCNSDLVTDDSKVNFDGWEE